MLRDEAVPPIDVDEAKSRRWALWHHQFDLVRAVDGVRYLRRWWIVKTPLGGIALHRMDGPDARDTLHDHPFTFLSVILKGGYVERRLRPRDRTVDEMHVVRHVNYVRAGVDAHAISHVLRTPTWTLLFVGPYVRSWGFWILGDLTWGWVPHDAFDSGHYVPSTKET